MLRNALYLSVLAAITACTDAGGSTADNPNEGLLRDFLDGKFDSAGHPLNAKLIEAETACGSERLTGACEGALPDGAMTGEIVVNIRLRVISAPSSGSILKAALLDASGNEVATELLTVSRLRGRTQQIDLALDLQGSASRWRIEPQAGSQIEVDYLEVFPKKFGLVVAPGSGVIADTDALAIELPRSRKLDVLSADGVDLLPRLDGLLAAGKATKTATTFRTLIEVPVGELLPQRGDVLELEVRGAGDAARVQLRRTAAPCNFEGDPTGKRVLITGFQPFPADGTHENVSGVAVLAIDPANLRNARVMRMVLPVEYDRAPSMIGEVIERCAPDIVISFGQGGNAIALEKTAYNLQDTGEIAGGVPDNRGVIRGAVPIEPAGPAERSTLLPLDAIRDAIEALGESPQDSIDPGRYICNNTMWNNIAVMGPRRGIGGFIHLPFTTDFPDDVKARFARVVEAAIQATVDAD